VDPYGRVVVRVTEAVARPTRPAQVRRALVAACRRAGEGAGPVRLAVVSAADPVDRATGRLVHLPDTPFLLGKLSPVQALGGLVAGPVTVDNDVNWAARAELAARLGAQAADLVYLFLGEGLGLAVVSDGEVRRGHRGIAGEIAHLVTTGADGAACHLTDVFRDLDLRRPGTTAIDVDRLLGVVRAGDDVGRHVMTALARAVAGVLAAAVALLDPALIVVGGPWGRERLVQSAIDDEFRRLPRHAPVEAARQAEDAPLVGARAQALTDLRDAIATGGVVSGGS
jgi:predicted NBD/HSP70 family sugar kinase